MGISDWSSDVCSSDLEFVGGMGQDVIGGIELLEPAVPEQGNLVAHLHGLVDVVADEQNGFPQLPLHFKEFILDDFAIDRVDRAKRDRKSAVEGKSVSVRVKLGDIIII